MWFSKRCLRWKRKWFIPINTVLKFFKRTFVVTLVLWCNFSHNNFSIGKHKDVDTIETMTRGYFATFKEYLFILENINRKTCYDLAIIMTNEKGFLHSKSLQCTKSDYFCANSCILFSRSAHRNWTRRLVSILKNYETQNYNEWV